MSSESRKRVLLVEDCADTSTVFCHLLESLGAEVATAADGEQGVEAALHAMELGDPFHLIIMDIRMPRVSGTAAAKRIRAHGFSGVIVACTATSSEEGRQESERSGFDEYLDKQSMSKKVMADLLGRL